MTIQIKNVQDIKDALASKGIKPAHLARLAGCDQSSLSKVIRGAATLTPKMMSKLEATLNILDEGSQDDGEQSPDSFVSTPTAQVVPYDFDGQTIQVIQAEEIMMTDRQLGEALGYANPGIAIAKLASEHADELKNLSTLSDLDTVDGKTRQVRVWREQGVYLLTMFSAQPKAAAFRKFAAETLYRVRREPQPQTPNDMLQVALARFADMSGLAMQNIRTEQAYIREQLETVQSQIKQTNPEATARVAVLKIQALNTKKARLHTLVNAIVNQTKSIPETDIFAKPYRRHQNVWSAVHAAAVPPVSSKGDYTTLAQVNTAIDAAAMLLTRLGGAVPPEQVEMDIVE